MTDIFKLIEPVTTLLKTYRRTSYYLPLVKFCFYELAISFYYLQERGKILESTTNPFAISTPTQINPDVSPEFLDKLRFQIRNLAQKIKRDDFNYCCINFIFEPVAPAQIKGLGDCVASELRKIFDSPLDNLKDIIIGTMYNLE